MYYCTFLKADSKSIVYTLHFGNLCSTQPCCFPAIRVHSNSSPLDGFKSSLTHRDFFYSGVWAWTTIQIVIKRISWPIRPWIFCFFLCPGGQSVHIFIMVALMVSGVLRHQQWSRWWRHGAASEWLSHGANDVTAWAELPFHISRLFWWLRRTCKPSGETVLVTTTHLHLYKPSGVTAN